MPKYASTLTGGTIALQDSSGASGSMIDAAISYWNDSCFGEGVAFPLMCAACSGPRLWVDRNHDGLMTNDENYSLGEVKVVQLDLGYEQAAGAEQYGLDAAGNYHFYIGSFVQQIRGREIVRALHDIYFAVVPRGLVAE